MAPFRVVIIGGGLSGPLLGNGLMNNNVDFTLYERDNENAKYEGYQIRLGEGALRGFSACLTPAHQETIMRKLGKSVNAVETAPSLFTSGFEQLLDLTTVQSYSKSAAINRVVLRDLLMEPLRRNTRVEYQKEFVDYEVVPGRGGAADKIKVNFRDGSSDTCDILVGADGSHSKMNSQVGLNNLVSIKSHWSFLLKGKLPYERMAELPAKLQQGPLVVFADGMSLFYALYLPDAPTGKPVSEDRKVPVAYDAETASFYWGLNVPVHKIPYEKPQDMDIKGRRNLCLEAIKDWAPEYHRMLSVGESDDGTDIHITQFTASTKPALDWRKNLQRNGATNQGNPHVWLLGDAAHAMQPNRGQGGNQSLCDCADALPQILRLHSLHQEKPERLTNMEIEKACLAYEQVMIPRAFEWVSKSGGISIPNLNFDGWLGTLIKIFSVVFLPIMQIYHRITS